MEKFNLTQTGQEVQEILDGAAKLSDVNTEKERAELAEEALGASIQQNAEDIDAIEAKIPSDATAENPLTDKEYVDGLVSDESTAREQADETLQGNIDAEETRAKAAEKQNADDIDAIEEKIPSDASSGNQLTTKNYVDNSVATASATFRGTYNLVSDLHLTVDASRSDIASALGNAIANADNNDYAFVQIPTSVDTPTEIGSIERYKFNGSAWTYEYTLNNSGYTAAQWAAINSGITSGLVAKLGSLPTASELETALLAKQDVLTFDSAPTPGSLNPVTSAGIHTAIDTEKGARQNADAALQQAIEAILVLIPSAASALNQLADKAFVNSSIATNTATFRGTFNLVSDLHLALNASHTDVANALANSISSANNNDYCFVQIPTSVDTPTEIRVTERYKFNGTAWAYEYDLNNSGFTGAQWEAINSAITSALVTKLSVLPTASELATELAGKQAVLTFDNQPTSGSSNPVKSGGVYDVVTAINAKIPSDADAANKMTTEARIATIIGALDATFDLTSADEHITFKMTQRDGQITYVQILTHDIASASALTTLGGRVSINEGDISNLRAAYAALTQSDIVIVNGALPSSGQQQNIIYRQLDPDHNPPQFYSDFMWNGTTWVLMAQYNNAIDPRPKKGSQNLVTSGGVFDNMGALDVSELNATENPHTLAKYADLTSALNALPAEYWKGGMSIKFVQSSDNKYAQYRLKTIYFSINVANWQGVDDSNVFDISAYNLTGGQPTKYADLTAALGTNGINVPEQYRMPGMTIRYIQSSDNKYVQYRLTTTYFSIVETNWQGVDDEPTAGSPNMVKSGGVFKDIVTNGSAFDISAYNNGTTYADLNAALTALNTLPDAYKKGGMSVKFVRTSDNNYVQYRLMKTYFSIVETNWQGVDDEPTAGSPNLVKSGGVYPFAKKTDDNTTILNTIPEFLSESKGVFENSFFENTESAILHTTDYPTNTAPGISQFYHEMEVTEQCFVTRISVNISALVSCDVDIYLLLKPIKNYAPLSHSSKRNITGDDSVELIINSFLLPNTKYYIYIKASTDNALKWTGNGLQSDLVRINGTYWKPSSDGDVSMSSLSTNIGLLGNVYSKGAVPNFKMESGNIIVKNRLLGSIYDAEASNAWIVINDGQINHHHEGSGNNSWEVPFKAEDTIKNFVRFVVNVTSITGTGRVWLFAYNTSNQKIHISIGFFSATGEHAYDIDLNYYAVYNQLDLTKRISVGVANFTDEFDAVYNKADVTDSTLREVETPQELNSLLENLQSGVSKATNKQEENAVPCLVSPNNTKYYLSVDNAGNLLAKPVIPSGKMLIIGNSLLFGFNTFGMCASDSEHDYYWKIRETLLTKSPELSITRIMGTPFEECTTQSDAETWMDNTLGSVLSDDYTLAIIQLGDNVNNASRISAFRTNAKLLINYIKEHCPNARIVWAGEWYSTVERQKIIKKACNETGADFIDISMIRSEETEGRIGDVINRGHEITQEYNFDSYTDDSTNHVLTIVFAFGGISYTSEVPYTSYTVNGSVISVTGEYTIVTNSGVASHPGDAGMLAIANKICYLLGITNDENEIS